MNARPLRDPKQPPAPVAALLIDRPVLQARLLASTARVVLLRAPAGSGKTTLIAQCLPTLARKQLVAWVSLDAADDDPDTLLGDLASACRGAASESGQEMAPPPPGPPAEDAPVDAAALAWIDAIAKTGRPWVVVLDAVEHLRGARAVHTLKLLMERSPPPVRWVLAGTSVPALPFGLLRLSDQLLTLEAADLKLDADAIHRLARKSGLSDFSRSDARGVDAATDGWVAGVKFALLAVRDVPGRDRAVHAVTAPQEDLASYFEHSVLHALDGPTLAFLIGTSLLERLVPALCDAVMGIDDSQQVLESLQARQLFVTAVDAHAHEFRCQPQLRAVLRRMLRRDSARQTLHHLRASRWLAEHRCWDEALHHAFAVDAAEWQRELVARYATTWLQSGDVAEVVAWCERLPRATLMADDATALPYVASLMLLRRFDESTKALAELEGRSCTGPAVHPARLALLHALRAILFDSDSAVDIDSWALLAEDIADANIRASALALRAYAMLRACRFDQAWRLAMRALDVLPAGSSFIVGYASNVLALAERARGELRSGAKRCEQVYAGLQPGRRNATWVNAAVALAFVRYEEDRLTEAEALCAEVLSQPQLGTTVENLTIAHTTLARVKAAGGLHDEALRLLDHLHSLLEGQRHRRFMAQVCAEKMRVHLLRGQVDRAQAVAEEFGLAALADQGSWATARPYDEAWERLGSAHAGLLLHQQQPEAARELFTVLRDSAVAVGYRFRVLPAELMMAACHWQAGRHDAAFRQLQQALAPVEGQRLSRSAFDETPGLERILAAALGQGQLGAALPPAATARLAQMLGSPRPVAPPSGRAKATAPAVLLTARELAVLKLLARGLDNTQISAQSQIALSTVKWHLKNVFGKLDVRTRAAAVARAREIRLIH